MAHRTTKRPGMYVDTSSIAKQNKQSIESVVAYKGFVDDKNNITNPQDSFVDLQNMYIDDDELLSTRAPVKKSDDITKIFGLYNINNHIFVATLNENSTLTISTGLVYYNMGTSNTMHQLPKITFAPIEDKIFIFCRYNSMSYPYNWTNGILVYDIIANTLTATLLNLYVPIIEEVTNDLRSTSEPMNYFTSTYRTRYKYGLGSSVDFSEIEGTVRVLDATDNDKFLYDIVTNKELQYQLLYPYDKIDAPNKFDAVENNGIKVFMCYYNDPVDIKVSFNGKSWLTLANVPNASMILDVCLYRDGTGIAILGTNGIYTADITELTAENYMSFVRRAYWTGALNKVVARGYFLSKDVYVHCSSTTSWNNGWDYYVHWDKGAVAQEFLEQGRTLAEPLEIKMCNYNDESGDDGPVIGLRLNSVRDIKLEFFDLDSNSVWRHNSIDSGLLPPDSSSYTYTANTFYISMEPDYNNSSASVYIHYAYLRYSNAYTLFVISKYFDREAINYGDTTITYTDNGATISWNSFGSTAKVLLGDTAIAIDKTLSSNLIDQVLPSYGFAGASITKTSFLYLPISLSLQTVLLGKYIWGIKNGILYTTEPTETVNLYIDEYSSGSPSTIELESHMEFPSHFASLEEHYFSFGNKLGIAVTKHDVNNNFLLYVPVNDMQTYGNDITNLYPLSTSLMAVFLADSVWYTGVVENDTSLLYKRPIKSKLPFGCREGVQIMTLADGQSIMFPVDRGLAILSPQDFVATTDPVVKYISDNIQNFYLRYYSDTIRTAEVALVTGVKFNTYFERPLEIKSCIYRYWLLIYKRYSNIVLIYDMRNGTWWKWKMPYPVVDLIVDDGVVKMVLYVVDAAEGTLDPTGQTITYDYTSDFGTLYQLDDKNANILLDEQRFPRVAEGFDDYDYSDEIVPGTLDGTVTDVTDQYSGQSYQEYHLAQSRIDWYGLSQKLYLGSINNYKAIRGINIVARGLYNAKAMLEVKIFRDVFHPEESLTMNMYIEDLRSFVQRLNLMHVIFFQFRISNPDNDEKQKQVHIASVSIKYETKEGIR